MSQLDGERASGDLDHRGRLAALDREVLGEAGGVDRGAGDDHLQVGTLRQELLQVAEDEVDVEAALVGLVDDQRVVAAQHPVALDLGEQDAVGHHLDQRGVADLVGEADGVADVVAQLRSQFLGDAFGDRAGGDPPGLRVPDHPVDTPAGFEAQLGQLGALARPGLAGDDHHLVVADRRQQLVAPLGDRQRVGVRETPAPDDRPRRRGSWVFGGPGCRRGRGHGMPARQPGSSSGTSHPRFPRR